MLLHSKLYVFSPLFLLIVILPFAFTVGQGTYPVFPDLADHSVSGDVSFLGALDNRLVYFDRVNDKNKLWVSDGSPAGTMQVSHSTQSDIKLFHQDSTAWYFTEQRGSTFLISKFGAGADTLIPLFSSGIRFLDIQFWQNKFAWIQQSAGSGYSRLQLYDPALDTLITLVNTGFPRLEGIGAAQEYIYYIMIDAVGKKLLGKSDGTTANSATFTQLFDVGSSFDQNTRFFSHGNQTFFFYNPDVDPFYLWTTDGTEAGTVQLGEYDDPTFGWPENPAVFNNGKFFFILREFGAPSGTTFELHATNGTPAGTVTLDDDEDYYLQPERLTLFNSKVYFISQLFWSKDLRVTDGSIAGTDLVLSASGHQQGGVGFIGDLGIYNNSLVIQAYTEELGSELYLNDGTSTGTTLLADVLRGETDSYAGNFMQVEDRLFFTVMYNGRHHIWIYDPAFVTSCNSLQLDSTIITHITDTTSTGTIQLFPTGGQQPFVYSLNGGAPAGSPIFNNLPIGTHAVTITDNLGCELTVDFEIKETTGVIDLSLLRKFNVLPNPAGPDDQVRVQLEMEESIQASEATIQCYLSDGRMVYHSAQAVTTSVVEFNLDPVKWSAGHCIITVHIDGKLAGSRMVVFE